MGAERPNLVRILLAGACLAGGVARAQVIPVERPPAIRDLDVVERLGERIPLDLTVTESDGRVVRLAEAFDDGRPVVLALVYYECPVVCSTVMAKLLACFNGLDYQIGRDFNVVYLSIDPTEKFPLAASVESKALLGYAPAAQSAPSVREGWAFLTAGRGESARLAESLGWGFREVSPGQYSHPVCIFVLTPDGRIARYLYGFDYPPKDMKLALLEATEGKIARSVVDRVMLFCYMYDPAAGGYTLAAMRVMRAGGIVSLVAVAGLIGTLLHRERRRRARRAQAAATADTLTTKHLAGQIS